MNKAITYLKLNKQKKKANKKKLDCIKKLKKTFQDFQIIPKKKQVEKLNNFSSFQIRKNK